MKVKNKRSNETISGGGVKIPSPSNLEYGEIAINYKAGKESLFIKNDDNEVVKFVSENQILVSPAFSGTPTAPTAASGDNTTQIANTIFVKTEIQSSALWESGDGVGSAVLKGSNNNAFGTNSVAEGTSTTDATSRNITTSSTDSEIITEWEASSPDTDKFSLAKGNGSHVEGNNGLALGQNSHVEGNGSIAGDNSAHAEGTGSRAMGPYSHAEGLESIASGSRAHAEGYGTSATNKSAHAEGHGSMASGERSHAEGFDTVASGKQSHAEGYSTDATANQSHAEGYESQASGNAAHSEGHNTVASGKDAHAEGVREGTSVVVRDTFRDRLKAGATEKKTYGTQEYASVSEQYQVGYKIWFIAKVDTSDITTDPRYDEPSVWDSEWRDVYDENITVTSIYSHPWMGLSKTLNIGNGNIRDAVIITSESTTTEYPNVGAKGEGSHIEGVTVNAINKGEHSEGKYNISISGVTQHTVGIGTADDARKNAHLITNDGKHYIPGIGTYVGTETTLPENQDLATVFNTKTAVETISNAEIDALFDVYNTNTLS